MSKQYPECPLYNHANCKEYENPTLCAIVREDKLCIKKKAKKKIKDKRPPAKAEVLGFKDSRGQGVK